MGCVRGGAVLSANQSRPRKGPKGEGPSSRASDADEFLREFPHGSQSAGRALITMGRLTTLVTEVFNRGLRRHGVSATGRQALAALDGAGQPLSPTAIAERLLLTTASITSLLDTLEGRGWVIRQDDPSDRRKQLVSLTVTGQQLVDEMLPEIVALQAAIMEDVAENDRQQLLRTLDRIHATITRLDPEAIAAAAPRRGKRPRI